MLFGLVTFSNSQSFELNFEGGGATDLASSFNRQTKLNVAIMVDPETRYKPFRASFSNTEGLIRSLPARLDFQRVGLAEAWFGHSSWPKYIAFSALIAGQIDFEPISLTDLIRRDGKYSFPNSSNKVVTVGSLKSLGFKRDVKVHWFFDKAAVAFAGTNYGETEILAAFAEAIGADLYIGDEYRLTPRVSAIKQRYVAALLRIASQYGDNNRERFLAADLRLLAAGVKTLTPTQLEKLFETPSSEVELAPLKGSELHKACEEKVALFFKRTEPDGQQSEQNANSAHSAFLQNIDWTKPFTLVLTNRGLSFVRMKGKDGRMYNM